MEIAEISFMTDKTLILFFENTYIHKKYQILKALVLYEKSSFGKSQS